MIKLGIFAKTFPRATVKEIAAVVKYYGFETMHFNMACLGLEAMPLDITKEHITSIQTATSIHQMPLCGLSGTFNMCHPNPAIREDGLMRLAVLARHARAMGTSLITLCTGTRDPEDQWRAHPDNNSRSAWLDMCKSMERALAIAETYEIQLGIEPELGNIVNTIPKAKQLLQEMGSDRLKIVLDPANLFETGTAAAVRHLIDTSLAQVGAHLAMAHAKDRDEAGHFVAAGKGVIPFHYFIKKLKETSFEGPLVVHGLIEEEVSDAVQLLQQYIDSSF
ncbi:MAG: sugar phosphate isomerase/epimerase [Saprospiraceae bacterium]